MRELTIDEMDQVSGGTHGGAVIGGSNGDTIVSTPAPRLRRDGQNLTDQQFFNNVIDNANYGITDYGYGSPIPGGGVAPIDFSNIDWCGVADAGFNGGLGAAIAFIPQARAASWLIRIATGAGGAAAGAAFWQTISHNFGCDN
jgi:hypothetical protein